MGREAGVKRDIEDAERQKRHALFAMSIGTGRRK